MGRRFCSLIFSKKGGFVCSCNVSGLSRPFLSSLRKGNIDIILSRKLLWLTEVKNLDVFCDLWWFYFSIPEKTLYFGIQA